MAAADRQYDEVALLWDYLYTHYKGQLTETEQKAGRLIIFGGQLPVSVTQRQAGARRGDSIRIRHHRSVGGRRVG